VYELRVIGVRKGHEAAAGVQQERRPLGGVAGDADPQVVRKVPTAVRTVYVSARARRGRAGGGRREPPASTQRAGRRGRAGMRHGRVEHVRERRPLATDLTASMAVERGWVA
jgi:hypothetical protein